jgi:hypothetical protein
MSFHPASSLFPLMDGVELKRLMDDIKAHGLIEPIVMFDGQVLDGRNRLRACEHVGVQPRFVEWKANGLTPTEWVVSMNLHRRHLTTAQRAALAVDLLPHLEAEAKERQREHGGTAPGKPSDNTSSDGGRSDAKAAELVGVGRSTVAAAKAIGKRDPALLTDMRAGVLNVAQASRQAGFEGMAQGGAGSVRTTRDAAGRDTPTVVYGKGDKFTEATQPLRRYLKSWETRNYEYRHVNPKDAAKRVEVIDELIERLTKARRDLASRTTIARMRV